MKRAVALAVRFTMRGLVAGTAALCLLPAVAGAADGSPSVRDAGLAADVRAALAATTGPAARAVVVEVVDGVVRLGGTVRSESDRAAVLAAVDGVAGVETVDDALQIGEPAPGSTR